MPIQPKTSNILPKLCRSASLLDVRGVRTAAADAADAASATVPAARHRRLRTATVPRTPWRTPSASL